MAETLPAGAGAAPSRFRGIVAWMLLIVLTVMVVRDILLRRRGSPL